MEHNPLVFRKAEEKDIPFLIETIIAAEKSGTDVFSYSKIFELPELEIRKILADILAEDATCLLYTSDAADERSSVDLGGRRIIKKKKKIKK